MYFVSSFPYASDGENALANTDVRGGSFAPVGKNHHRYRVLASIEQFVGNKVDAPNLIVCYANFLGCIRCAALLRLVRYWRSDQPHGAVPCARLGQTHNATGLNHAGVG